MNVTEESYLQDVKPFFDVLHAVLYAAVFFVGLIGNILVMYSILYFPKMQTVTNIYILNLAIADVCFLLGVPFLIATMIENQWVFGPVVCKLYLTSTGVNQFTTAFFMLVISIDRYIAVCHPNLNRKFRTTRYSKFVSTITWIMSMLLILPIFQHATEISNQNGTKSCVLAWWSTLDVTDLNSTNEDNNTSLMNNSSSHDLNNTLEMLHSKRTEYWMNFGESMEFAFITYTFVLSFALPLSLIAVFYGLIVHKLVSYSRPDENNDMRASRKKVTKMVLVVIAVYIICWLPHWVIQWLLITREIFVSKFIVIIYMFISWLSYSNSAINPILYGFLSKNFRKTFLKAYTKAGRPLLPKSRKNVPDNIQDKYEVHSSAIQRDEQATLVTNKTIDTSFSDSQDSTPYNKCAKTGQNMSFETTSL